MPQMVPHGTLDYGELAEWGLRPDELIVFSSNINPYGPPPSVVQAVAGQIDASALSSYPDRLSRELRQALAGHHGAPAESILVGNGTADIMWLLAVLFLRGKRTAILSPTFGEYANAANVVGVDALLVSVPGWRKYEDQTFAPDDSGLDETIDELRRLAPDVVFACNPNSPTGEHRSPQEMEALLGALPGALWIVDEAYAAFTPQPWSATPWSQERNVIVLHSMTKDFALGGLRLGYAAAHPEIIARMADAQPPWNVNSLAQIGGEGLYAGACVAHRDAARSAPGYGPAARRPDGDRLGAAQHNHELFSCADGRPSLAAPASDEEKDRGPRLHVVRPAVFHPPGDAAARRQSTATPRACGAESDGRTLAS